LVNLINKNKGKALLHHRRVLGESRAEVGLGETCVQNVITMASRRGG
jgi:hypothetical protein